MLEWIREKFGTVIIGGIITFIAFVFVFYGVFSPKSTRGLHEGAVAGTVNGDPISIADFNRELNRRIEFFKNIGGGKISDDQLKAFRIREGVFQELAGRKVLLQEARKKDLTASDDEVRQKIQEIPAFQKDGKFDVTTYRQVLEANGHTAGSFERLVREDLSVQQWDAYFKDQVHVAEAELKKEFQVSKNLRNIKYVILNADAAKKDVKVDPAEVQKFLNDPAKLNLAKMKFEEAKETEYKGKSFDQVKETLVRNLIAGEKVEELQKINNQLADQVIQAMDPKSGDAKVNQILKPYSSEVKKTGLIAQTNSSLSGVGEAKEVFADAFAAQSPIDATAGGKAKKYAFPGRVVVAQVVESKKPDFSQLGAERDTLIQKISSRKSRELFQGWMKSLMDRAKIDPNPAIVSSESH